MKFDNKNSKVRIKKGSVGPFYEYTMSKKMAEYYLENRKGADRGVPWRDYLAAIVNTEFGIRGTCASLVVE